MKKEIIVQPYDGSSTLLYIGKYGVNDEVEFLAVVGQNSYSFEKTADTIDVSDKTNSATNANQLIAERLGVNLKQQHFSNQKSFIPGAIENKITVEGIVYANDRAQRVLEAAINDGEALWFEERAYSGGYTRQFLGYIGSYKEEAKKGDKATYSCDVLVTSQIYKYPSFYGKYVGDPVILMAPDTFEVIVEENDTVNLMNGVIARDKNNAVLTLTVINESLIDFNTVGTYTAIYKVVDASGNVTEGKRDYIVVPAPSV